MQPIATYSPSQSFVPLKFPPKPSENLPTPAEIIAEASAFYRVSERELKGGAKTMFVSWCRHVCCLLVRECLGKGLGDTGRTVGLADHSSVFYAVRHVKSVIEVDERKAAQVRELRRRIHAKWPAITLDPVEPPAPVFIEEIEMKPDEPRKPMTMDERIEMHRQRFEAATAKFVPPTLAEGVEIGRAAVSHGPQGVFAAIANAYRLRRAAVSSDRHAATVNCRCAIVFVLREMGLSYPEIAEEVGLCSHSVSISSYKRAVRLLSEAA